MKSRICLIRHGITEGNVRKLYYGYSDIPLAEEGVEGLKKLTESGIYPDSEKTDFYTSGLIRTEQTLSLIYGQREHKVMDSLREINFGIFEMKSYHELNGLEEYQTWIGDKTGNLVCPGGESLVGFQRRIIKGFKELRKLHAVKELSLRHHKEEALSVVVCHGGTISAIMENTFPGKSGEADNFFRWVPDPGHGYILTIDDGQIVGKEEF
ncbi:MAG: histidine phosphatase family protein [Clostridiales bacterium]|nr:histidine phosphatase family protein [Clostridiales bacterium]